MSIVSYASQAIYWTAKAYFMVLGIIYIFALLGRIDMGVFTHVTGVIGLLFLLSNVYWHIIRK